MGKVLGVLFGHKLCTSETSIEQVQNKDAERFIYGHIRYIVYIEPPRCRTLLPHVVASTGSVYTFKEWFDRILYTSSTHTHIGWTGQTYFLSNLTQYDIVLLCYATVYSSVKSESRVKTVYVIIQFLGQLNNGCSIPMMKSKYVGYDLHPLSGLHVIQFKYQVNMF